MPKDTQAHTDPGIEGHRRYADERTELLEVIREIVDQEIEAKLREYHKQAFRRDGQSTD